MSDDVYDLEAMKAPRAAGGLLRVLVALAENRATAPALRGTLLKGAGIPTLRAAVVDEPLPAVHPLFEDTPSPPAQAPQPDLGAIPESEGSPFLSARELVAAYRDGSASPEDVAQRVLDATKATEALERPLRVFIAQDAGDVMAMAEASAARWKAGEPLGPLDGVPIAVKDELDQKGYPTTVGTRFLGTSTATADAEVVRRLREAGAVLIGKANMHEIGLGVTGLNPHHGACRNPYDPSRATGGSSSGPAAAVAAGLCPISVGADGGGSVRVPAALCGVFGIKATYGRISEHGAAPLCWSVAHVGPLAATAYDLALGYGVMAGPDPHDANSLRQPAPTLEGVDGAVDGVKIGVFEPWFEHAEPGVVKACRAAIDGLAERGAEIVPVAIEQLALLRAAHLVTIVTEMAASHDSLYDVHRKDYALDTRLNLTLARSLTARDYINAQRLRIRFYERFQAALRTCDVIATPAIGRTAPELPDGALKSGESNLPVTDAIMRFAPPGNLTGHPGVSIPVGYDDAGLPVGLQLMGRPWDEALLLRLAFAVEQGVDRRLPKVHHRLLD